MAKKILVVDDEVDILEVLTFRLEKLGYEVSSAADGQKALDLLEKEIPDLILLDLRLPVIDGYEVCRRVKKEKKWKNIPIIMLTASSAIKVEKMVEKYNVEGCMMKPFEYEKLIAKIEGIIG